MCATLSERVNGVSAARAGAAVNARTGSVGPRPAGGPGTLDKRHLAVRLYRMPPLPRPRRRAAVRALVPAAVLVTAALVTACGGDGRGSAAGGRSSSASCAPDSGVTVAAAVAEFIKTAQPTPQRYLMASSTDSALPEAGMRALQDKGPTYYYPADTAQRAKVRAQLANIGDYNTILVVLHGVTPPAEGRTTVRLGGHYVGGKADGQSTAPRSYAFVCDTAGWRLADTAAAPRP